MVKKEKEAILKELKEFFSGKKAIYFTEYKGIDANAMNIIRRDLRKSDSLLRIVKNRIAKMALDSVNIDIPPEVLKGVTAVIVTQGDPVVPARKIKEFRDEDIVLGIKGAYIEGKFYVKEEVEKLSEIPPKEELFAQLVGGLSGVLYNLVFILEAKIRELVGVIEKILNERR